MAADVKIQKQISEAELPGFLRELADSIEKGEGEFETVADFKKFKMSGKNQDGQLTMKVKFKSAKAEDETEADGKPKYKKLKKRMKSCFRVIFKGLHEGRMPPADMVSTFLADSELMISYPGYGDEYYERYAEACKEFKAAYEAKDMPRLNETVDALQHLKAECHAKYD